MRALRLQLPFQIPWSPGSRSHVPCGEHGHDGHDPAPAAGAKWIWKYATRRNQGRLEILRSSEFWCSRSRCCRLWMSAHLPAVLVRRFVIRRVRQYSTDPAPVLACPHLTQDYTHGKCEMNPEYIYIYKHILIRYVYSIDHVTCSTYVCIHTYIYLDIHLNLNMGYPPTISTGWLWWSFAALDVMFLGVWWLFYVHRRL